MHEKASTWITPRWRLGEQIDSLLEPLAERIGHLVRDGKTLSADDLPVKMQAPGLKRTRNARVWTYVSDKSGAGWVLHRYASGIRSRLTAKATHPVDHLAGYKCVVHADGFAKFNGLFGKDRDDEQACLADVRRKFVEVCTAQGSSIAEEAIRRLAEAVRF